MNPKHIPRLSLLLLALVLGMGACTDSGTNSKGNKGGRAGGPREVPVTTAQPKLKDFALEVEALGTVRAKESVDITAKVADRVAAIHFEEGKQVRKGEVLVELDNEEARADLAAAEAAERDSRSQFKRSKELFQTRALSEAQLDQLEATMLANQARVAAARSRLNDRLIRAPFDGRVGLRNVSLGSLVSPGGVITTLDDLSIVKLDFAVPELFLSSLKPGLTVEAQTTAYPNTTFKGRVDSVDTRVDPTTRAIVVRALIDNKDHRLRPGMFMTLQLVRKAGMALMLPESAIVPEDSKHFVFVVADGRARKREIKIGRRRPGEVEILTGVTEKDTVVIDGTLNLHDGTPVATRTESAPQVAS
ncbi:MAG TPA: efflux RND transporter periplasmic adaptor subunit [Steroidobacter sp.]|uniref:efflux RND transporter periplasmic adaptor subunit n=1 Tax=Steroidobacter sp. TaxID=1978227 RepID=UPI002ED98E1E